jgi:hypothetical protein
MNNACNASRIINFWLTICIISETSFVDTLDENRCNNEYIDEQCIASVEKETVSAPPSFLNQPPVAYILQVHQAQ